MANKAVLGKKLNNSHLVFQVVKLIYEGVPDMQISRILEDRYSYKVSIPSVASFRVNYYPKRLDEMKRFSDEFNEEQTGQVKTFIDVSLMQAAEIKKDIRDLEKRSAFIDKEMDFIQKFEGIFHNAIDGYVNSYDPEHPSNFLDSNSSPEETSLSRVLDTMGEPGRIALSTYIASHTPQDLIKLFTTLKSKILDQREALVKIHKEIFKGCRNYSILQELTMVFERYNSIIIEEFFPDARTMDKAKYYKLRKKILALYEEFQLRYQGFENPQDQGRNPSQSEAESLAETASKHGIDKAKEIAAVPVKKLKGNVRGKTPSKSLKIKRQRELEERERREKEEIENSLTMDEEKSIEKKAEEMSRSRDTKGSMDNLFSSILDPTDEVVARLDSHIDSGSDNRKDDSNN